MTSPQITEHGQAPDGTPLQQIAIGRAGLSARILTLGATVQDLRLAGHGAPLILGFSDAQDYIGSTGCLGAIVGRCANRIAGGQFTLDGTQHQLDRNENDVQCLHGGRDGLHVQTWAILDLGPDHVTLGVTLAEGHMGFPGQLDLQCCYRIVDNTLTITLSGETTAPTYCNPASHIYYNLTGQPTALDHRLRVDAAQYLPVDARSIPLGTPADVAGTAFDLRQPATFNGPVDHNFCLAEARRPLTPVAELSAGNLRMEMATTEPGLQVYDGGWLDIAGRPGLDGVAYGRNAGIALEPQAWPDAPNQAWAAQALLRPGETYHSETRLAFVRST
ncbi:MULTISPECIES: aldose epimerase family protein [unclassified Marinovum]